MQRFLFRLLVKPFYISNAGFFLFFFFLFFGAVQSGSLIFYHKQLMISILQSYVVLAGVCALWLLYYRKTYLFYLRMIHSGEGTFLYLLQLLSAGKRFRYFLTLHFILFAPVLIYSIVLMTFGWRHNYTSTSIVVLLFQVSMAIIASYNYYRSIRDWNKSKRIGHPLTHKRVKYFPLLIFYHFWYDQRWLFLSLKALSLVLLFIVMAWNRDTLSNDSFLLFFQMITFAHIVLVVRAVSFTESKLRFIRNLPLSRLYVAGMYFLAYGLLLVPELLYSLSNAGSYLAPGTLMMYFLIAVTTLFLVTSIYYSEDVNKADLLKVSFMLFFISSIALHAEKFLAWLLIIFIVAVILFRNGYYSYQLHQTGSEG